MNIGIAGEKSISCTSFIGYTAGNFNSYEGSIEATEGSRKSPSWKWHI